MRHYKPKKSPRCRGKKIYRDKVRAEFVASSVLTHKGNLTTALRIYHCSRCKGWHLTKEV